MDANPDLNTGPKIEAKAKVGKSSVSRWLAKPPQSAPGLDAIAAVARAFGVKAWELLLDDTTDPDYIIKRLFRR